MKILAGLKSDTEQSKGLIYSIALTGMILVVEVIAGFMTNSLALLSDAAHVLTDVFSLGLALFAIILSAMPASDTRTYGWHRSEVFAALINGVTLVFISGLIMYEAVQRVMAPEPVMSTGMFIAAVFGLVVNLLVVHKLHGHHEHDLNMRSAFLHVVGDALMSVGVIIGAVIIRYTGWYIVDPILSIVFSLVILKGSVAILYDASHILLEGVPKGIDINDVVAEIKRADHVMDVHRLHVWSICSNISALSAHVMIDPGYHGSRKKILDDINCRLMSCFRINHATLQLEKEQCEYNGLVCDIAHCDIGVHAHAHGGHETGLWHPNVEVGEPGCVGCAHSHADHDHDHAHTH